MIKEGWVTYNKKSIKIGGPTWKKLTPLQQSKLIKKSKNKNEKPKKFTSGMKKPKNSKPRPKLFDSVPKDLRKQISPKGWKRLEDQVWEVLWRITRIKISTGIVSGDFSLERCLNGIVGVSDRFHFITHLKEVEIWDYIQTKLSRSDIDYGFISIGAYIEGILSNIIFNALQNMSESSQGSSRDGPFTDKDLKLIPDSEVLEWAIIFGHSYAIFKMIEETKRMTVGDAIDSFAMGRAMLRK